MEHSMMFSFVCVLMTLGITHAVGMVDQNGAGMAISRLFPTKDASVLTAAETKDNGTGCGCLKYNCGCCSHLQVQSLDLNDTVCTNITYLPTEYGISATLTVDGKVWVQKKVSLKNPPPICAAIPYLKKIASLCVKFYNMDVKGGKLSGCAMIQAHLEGFDIEDFDLGCFKIPPGGNKVMTHFQLDLSQDGHHVSAMENLLRGALDEAKKQHLFETLGKR